LALSSIKFREVRRPRRAAFRAEYGGFKQAIIGQETGGQYGVRNREGSGAGGLGQIMPETEKALARRLGIPYQPHLMEGTSEAAKKYQDALTDAAVREAWDYGQRSGNLGDAAMYYHGGSNRKIWGQKTRKYGQDILARMRGR
jgi:soluble lytic murein transglycosylase-like protein